MWFRVVCVFSWIVLRQAKNASTNYTNDTKHTKRVEFDFSGKSSAVVSASKMLHQAKNVAVNLRMKGGTATFLIK